MEKTLRASFKKTPMFSEALKRAKEEYFEESKNGKKLRRVRYKCNGCGRYFKNKGGEIAVDHIEPVISLEDGFVNMDVYISRLFCSVDNLQVLCNYPGERDGVKSCHKIKTATERALAALNKRKRRDNMYYDRVYRVKVWVFLEDLPKKMSADLLDFFEKAEARLVKWPAKSFKDTIYELKNKGWAHEFKPDSSGNTIISPQFLNLAFVTHLKKTNPQAVILNDFERPIYTIDRRIDSDSDYERIFNEVASIFSSTSLSMVFMIGELCHGPHAQVKVFVSDEKAPNSVIKKIADNVITIKKDGGDINTKSLKTEEVIEKIINVIQKLI